MSTESKPEMPEPPPQPAASIVINEVELNPEGQDSGNEWVELYNPTEQTVDIGGWTIRPTSGMVSTYTIPQGTTMGPEGRLVITFPQQFLDNSDESVVLYDNQGNEVDRTLLLVDTDSDNYTWQRQQDGSDEWIFKPATKETAN